MCFSAEASFSVSVALLPAAAYCIRTAMRKNRAYLPLAMIPLIFAIQQFSEGLVWIGLGYDWPALIKTASLSYLFFALAFWLFWIPFSILLIEPRRVVKWFLGVVAVGGMVYGAVLFTPVALDPGARLRVGIDYNSIQYSCGSLEAFQLVPKPIWLGLYIVIVLFPLLASAHRHFHFFTLTLAVAATVSHIFYWYAFISVWCFFAAILSLQLCFILRALLGPVEVPALAKQPG